MKINYVRMENVIRAERDTEILTTDLRKEIKWLATEYRRMAGRIASANTVSTWKPNLQWHPASALADEALSVVNIGELSGVFGIDYNITQFCSAALRVADKYASIANESATSRSMRRATERIGWSAPAWQMGIDEIAEEVA